MYKQIVKREEKEVEEDSTTVQTNYVEQDLNPKWNEVLVFDCYQFETLPSSVKLRVFDYDEIGASDELGHCVIPLEQTKNPVEKWVELDVDHGLLGGAKVILAKRREAKIKHHPTKAPTVSYFLLWLLFIFLFCF